MGENIETIFDLADNVESIKSAEEMLAEEINVQKVTDFLYKFGITVKTECGNYRPTYDVLKDIGEVLFGEVK